MFILYVRQVVTDEAFKKQEAKDGVCFYFCYFLNVLLFYSYSVLFCCYLHISHTHLCMYVCALCTYVHAACMQYHVCNMPLYMCVQDVITDETVQQQGMPDVVSLCNLQNCSSVFVSSQIVCCCCLCLLTHMYVCMVIVDKHVHIPLFACKS